MINKIVKITVPSAKFNGKTGIVVGRNDIYTTKGRIIEAYDVKELLSGEILRVELSNLETIEQLPQPQPNSIEFILSVIWGGEKWNGKIYGDSIYIKGEKIRLTVDQMQIFQQRPTIESMGGVLKSKKQDLSQHYGVYDSTFCEVCVWDINGVEIKSVTHLY